MEAIKTSKKTIAAGTVSPDDIQAVIKAQHEWLKTLQSIPPRKPILIKAIEGKTPENTDSDLYRWLPYPNIWYKIKQPIYTRGILPNEILIDPDTPEWNDMRAGIGKLTKYCKENNIPFIQGFSGGKGIHVSIFFNQFDVDEDLKNGINETDIDVYKTVRRALVISLAEKASVDLDDVRMDWGKINFNVESKGSQVRTFGTTRAPGQYKTVIEEIPDHKPEPYELPLIFPEKIEMWEIKETEYEAIAKDALKYEIERAKKANEYVLSDVDFSGIEIMKFPCIKKLFEAGIKNGRYYAGLSVLLMCKKCGITKEETRHHLVELFNTFPSITQEETNLRIDNALTMYDTDKHFSCRHIKETHGDQFCNFSNCPVKEKIEKEKKKENALKKTYSPEVLKSIPIPGNPREKLQIVKQFIEEYLIQLVKSEAEEVIITDIKEHFHLNREEISNVKKFYKEIAYNRKDRYAELSKNWTSDLEIDKEFEGLYTLQWNSEKTKVIDILLHFDKIARKVSDSLSTISYKGQIYVYRDGYYESQEEIVMQEITRIINGIRKGRFSSGIKSCSANVLHNILYFNPVTEYPFNQKTTAIPVKNGIILLDFENKEKNLIPHSPEYKFNYMIPTEYNENADPKPIDNILKQYSPDQVKELYQLPAQAIMQMLGYGPFKKCYLLQGNRDAGKSSYIELLVRTFGACNRSDVSLDMLNPKENKFALSSLEGKIFNIHDDMTYFSLKDTGTIKDLTGSYTKEIEKKGKQRYGADIRAVHGFACNKPPKYDGEIKKDIAFWERWVYIYFPNRFDKVLTFYEDNFTPENLSGFLNRVLDYVLEIGHDRKLVCNYSYADVRNTWAKCADPVYRFVTENMEKIGETEKPMYYKKDDFLELLKAWAKDQGEGEDEEVPATVTMLSKTIDICGIDPDTRITEETTCNTMHVYGLPYKWKEDSLYKDKRQPVIQLKVQAKFDN